MAKKKTFETELQTLEQIVRELESGNLSLEESMKQYEAGIACAAFCKKILDQTEQKVAKLTRGLDESLEETPFETAES